MSSALQVTGDSETIYLTDYAPRRAVRLVIITTLALGAMTALAVTGQFSHWSLLSNLWQSLTCVGIGIVFLGSISWLIYKAKKGQASGNLLGCNHWKRCIVERLSDKSSPITNNSFYFSEQFVDFSGLDEQGNGTARLFFKKPIHATLTGAMAAMCMPIYVVAVMAYNLFRLIIIPFYIVVQIIREANTGSALYPDQGKFAFADIPKQMALSLARLIQAPFYGVAMFFAALYALIDPLNGIKLGAAIEYNWNDQVPMRNSGIWMMRCKVFPDWLWEGGGGPKKLGQNGFYFAGSWQPYRNLQCRGWQITEICGVNSEVTEETIQLLTTRQAYQIGFTTYIPSSS